MSDDDGGNGVDKFLEHNSYGSLKIDELFAELEQLLQMLQFRIARLSRFEALLDMLNEGDDASGDVH